MPIQKWKISDSDSNKDKKEEPTETRPVEEVPLPPPFNETKKEMKKARERVEKGKYPLGEYE
jgi:hypothetical protein